MTNNLRARPPHRRPITGRRDPETLRFLLLNYDESPRKTDTFSTDCTLYWRRKQCLSIAGHAHTYTDTHTRIQRRTQGSSTPRVSRFVVVLRKESFIKAPPEIFCGSKGHRHVKYQSHSGAQQGVVNMKKVIAASNHLAVEPKHAPNDARRQYAL